MCQKNITDKILPLTYYFIFFVILGAFIYVFKPVPTDDFLRHIRFIDYKALGGYAYMFPNSYFSNLTFDPWYGFDLIAGQLKYCLGRDNAVFLLESAASLLFLSALLFNLKGSLDKHLFPLITIFLFIFFVNAFPRLSNIRPATFMAILFLFALRGKHFLAGMLGTMVAASFYWLYFLYSLPLALAHYIKGKKSFSYGLLTGTIISLIAWLYFTDFTYAHTVTHLIKSMLFSREAIKISENALFIRAIFYPLPFLLIFTAALTIFYTRRVDLCIVLLIFSLPLSLQVRYFLDLSAPLIFIYLINTNHDRLLAFAKQQRGIFDAFALASIFLVTPVLAEHSIYSAHQASLSRLSLKQGETLYATSMDLAFSTAYYNLQPVHIYPCPEVGWNTKETNLTTKHIQEKGVDESACTYLKKYGIHYLMTRGQVTAGCLQRSQIFPLNDKEGQVELWQVL